MLYKKIEKYLNKSNFIKRFDEVLQAEKHNTGFSGLNGCAKSILLARALLSTNRNILFVSNYQADSSEIAANIGVLTEGLGGEFPDFDILDYEERNSHFSVCSQRVQTLSASLQPKPRVYCVQLKAMMRRLAPKSQFSKMVTPVEVGMIFEPQTLFQRLFEAGYTPCYQVQGVGQVAKRGDIVDVFPINCEHPVRIDFFDNEIEEIKTFFAATQLSKKSIGSLEILPKNEFPIFGEIRQNRQKEKILKSGYYEGIESDISLLFEKTESFLDYIKNPIIFFDDFNPNDAFDEILLRANLEYKNQNKRLIAPPERIYFSKEFLQKSLKRVFYFSYTDFDNSITISNNTITSQSNLRGDLTLLKRALNQEVKKRHKIFILSNNLFQSQRLKQVLGDYGQKLDFCVGVLSEGINFEDAKLSIFTHNQIFDRYQSKGKKFSFKEAINDYKKLNCGDIVVHIDHGIGIFEGLTQMRMGLGTLECLTIRYAKGDVIYLPTYKMGLVTKYIAQEDVLPKLSTIGNNLWRTTQTKVKKAIERVAQDILKLYAQRKSIAGIGFEVDTTWQGTMEDAFVHETTPDQKRATNEIKADMEAPVPMERVLCGDVGFGKTEVAVRAAFKAVCSGWQVCVLAPTTLLAEQLYFVFKQRLSLYPVEIALFNRFISKSQIAKNLLRLKSGTIDIAIGTHRLLSKDVCFKKLGFLVIDDEHRFGVRQKERLRKLKTDIDTLFMSATPIPRTLNMALCGTKQISLIQTPPNMRMSVITQISNFSHTLIKKAVNRELERDGQIFFIHNRIGSIYQMEKELTQLLPNVRIAVAHGQMPEKMLERVMLDFYHHSFDVLITTTIVESGIDIPNANTIFINRADKFGLSQLYQMRGRVGRSTKEAYCYFLIRRRISQIQKKRLSTLCEFNYFGAGYQIALMDLHIRGTGNLLGTKQSGNIAAVGYNYYNQLLEAQIKKLKGEKVEDYAFSDMADIQIAGNFAFPHEYIKNEAVRVEIYRRMGEFATLGEFDDLIAELIDRFGKLPKEAEQTITYFKIRNLVQKLKITQLKFYMGLLKIVFLENPSKRQIKKFMKSPVGEVSFKLSPKFTIYVKNIEEKQIISALYSLFKL